MLSQQWLISKPEFGVCLPNYVRSPNWLRDAAALMHSNRQVWLVDLLYYANRINSLQTHHEYEFDRDRPSECPRWPKHERKGHRQDMARVSPFVPILRFVTGRKIRCAGNWVNVFPSGRPTIDIVHQIPMRNTPRRTSNDVTAVAVSALIKLCEWGTTVVGRLMLYGRAWCLRLRPDKTTAGNIVTCSKYISLVFVWFSLIYGQHSWNGIIVIIFNLPVAWNYQQIGLFKITYSTISDPIM